MNVSTRYTPRRDYNSHRMHVFSCITKICCRRERQRERRPQRCVTELQRGVYSSTAVVCSDWFIVLHIVYVYIYS